MAAASERRKKLSPAVEAQILTESRRRCCLCYHLDRDSCEKRGQIAHIDRRRSNNAETNLAFLCLSHHDAYDGKPSQSKGFTPTELRGAKKSLYEFLQKQSCTDRVTLLLTVEADFDKLTEREQRSLLGAILEAIKMKWEVRILNIEKGSIRFTIEVNAEDAARISKSFNSGQLEAMGVTDVRLKPRVAISYSLLTNEGIIAHEETRVLMSSGSLAIPREAVMPQLSVPVETYSALEQLIQKLQIEILLTAAQSAEPEPVEAMRRAIRQITESPRDRRFEEVATAEVEAPDPQAYLWLDRRLDNLRGYVFRFAKCVAEEAHLPEVTAGVIRTSWEAVFSNPSLTKEAFGVDAD